MTRYDYTTITELPTSLLSPDQIHRFAHRYAYAHRLAEGRRVLEVACGSASGLDYVAQGAAQVVGLDYTSGVLYFARQDTHMPLVQADAQQIPIVAASFDLVLCFEAIYYLEDYRAFLAECRRVLAPGGTLLICHSNPDWPNFAPGPLTTHYPDLPELAASLTRVGFHNIQCYGTLPITTTGTRQRIINTLRKWVVKSGILPWLGPLRTVLQQLSYGHLYPLPATIDAEWISTWQSDLALTPLCATQRDKIYRVHYLEADQ